MRKAPPPTAMPMMAPMGRPEEGVAVVIEVVSDGKVGDSVVCGYMSVCE